VKADLSGGCADGLQDFAGNPKTFQIPVREAPTYVFELRYLIAREVLLPAVRTNVRRHAQRDYVSTLPDELLDRAVLDRV
jgi:hypothetical protein